MSVAETYSCFFFNGSDERLTTRATPAGGRNKNPRDSKPKRIIGSTACFFRAYPCLLENPRPRLPIGGENGEMDRNREGMIMDWKEDLAAGEGSEGSREEIGRAHV